MIYGILKVLSFLISESKECCQLLRNWGLVLDSDPIELEGRVLKAPTIHVNHNYHFTPSKTGDFGKEIMKQPCYEPVSNLTIANYTGVILLPNREIVLTEYLDLLCTL